MKTTIRQIKRLIREALREATGTMWGTKEELDHSISAMDPETIVDLDYVDVDTGEVYLEKGQSAGESRLHPEYARQAEVERVARDQSWADEEAQWAKEDAEEASYQANKINDASNEFSDASRKFAESAKSYRGDLGFADDQESNGESIANDMADNFFHAYPQWAKWAAAMKLSRRDMKELVASDIIEAMSS